MNKKVAVISVASVVAALVPVADTFADVYNDAVVDQIQVTVSTVCNMTSSVTPQPGAPNGTYSKTVTPGTLVGGTGQPWEGNVSVMTYSCNNAGGWKVTAQGVDGVGSTTAQTVLAAGSGGTDIATGTATSGDVSNWAFRVSGTGAVSEYTSFSAVPGTSTAVASSTVAGTSVYEGKLTPEYRVWVANNQESDTYTGYVKYILTAPL